MCRPAGAFLIFSHDSHSFRCGLRFVVPTALFGNTELVRHPSRQDMHKEGYAEDCNAQDSIVTLFKFYNAEILSLEHGNRHARVSFFPHDPRRHRTLILHHGGLQRFNEFAANPFGNRLE